MAPIHCTVDTLGLVLYMARQDTGLGRARLGRAGLGRTQG